MNINENKLGLFWAYYLFQFGHTNGIDLICHHLFFSRLKLKVLQAWVSHPVLTNIHLQEFPCTFVFCTDQWQTICWMSIWQYTVFVILTVKESCPQTQWFPGNKFIFLSHHKSLTCLLHDSDTDKEIARHFQVPHKSACTEPCCPILVCLQPPPPPPACPAADGTISCPPGPGWAALASWSAKHCSIVVIQEQHCIVLECKLWLTLWDLMYWTSVMDWLGCGVREHQLEVFSLWSQSWARTHLTVNLCLIW